MCYKFPGPRCSSHARKELRKARAMFQGSHCIRNFERVKEAEAQYSMTPAGQKELRKQIEASGDSDGVLSARLEYGIAARKLSLSNARVSDKGDVHTLSHHPYGKFGTLPAGTAFQSEESVAAGNSAFVCSCGHNLTNKQEQESVECLAPVYCNGCHVQIKNYDFAKLNLMVIPSAVPFLKDDVVRASKWYHASNNPNWMSDVLTDPENHNKGKTPYVHLGTLASALERAKSEHCDYLYAIDIEPSVRIDPGVATDINDWPDFARDASDDMGNPSEDADIMRYLNRWEVAGSISLMADPRKLLVKSRKNLRATVRSKVAA